MSDLQIEKEFEFLKQNYLKLSEPEKRSLWANLSQLCEEVAIKIAKKTAKEKEMKQCVQKNLQQQ